MNAHTPYQRTAHIPLQFGWPAAYHGVKIHGGPFDDRPRGPKAFNVCVRAERAPKDAIHAYLPIVDFEVPGPEQRALVEETLLQALTAGFAGKEVYVGCMGGIGRTGLFLALLAKTAGFADPVGFVRSNYDKRAVETGEQRAYVETFDVTRLQRRLIWPAWRARALGWFS
jgi:hypothetical protein